MNGKGSKPRHKQDQNYRDNFDLVFNNKKSLVRMRNKQRRLLDEIIGKDNTDYIFGSIDEELEERFR